MKKLFYFISVAAFMASFASCGKIDQGTTPADDPSTDGTTTLTISTSLPERKTYLSGGSTKWVAGDLITVFAEDGTSGKSDAVDAPTSTYDFKFKDWPKDKTPKYALAVGPQSYYDLYTVSYETGLINATLRTSQVLYHQNSFSKLANIGVGEVVYTEDKGYTTYMKNLCGLIKFQVEGKNVEKVKISELDGKSLTGEVQIGMDEKGNPEVRSVLSGRPYVEISATSSQNLNQNSGMLPQGADIYACVLPGKYRIKVESYAKGGELLNTLTLKDGVMEVNRNEIATIGDENTTIKVDTFKPTTEGDEGEGEGEVEDIVLTLDFASWPFAEGVEENKNITEDMPCTFMGYAFLISNSEGWQYRTSVPALQGNALDNDGDFSLKLPAIENRKLYSVGVTLGNNSGKYIGITSTASGSGVKASVSGLKAEMCPYVLGGENWKEEPAVNTSYYICSGGKTVQFKKLVLTYTYVAPTPAE